MPILLYIYISKLFFVLLEEDGDEVDNEDATLRTLMPQKHAPQFWRLHMDAHGDLLRGEVLLSQWIRNV